MSSVTQAYATIVLYFKNTIFQMSSFYERQYHAS